MHIIDCILLKYYHNIGPIGIIYSSRVNKKKPENESKIVKQIHSTLQRFTKKHIRRLKDTEKFMRDYSRIKIRHWILSYRNTKVYQFVP